MLVSLAFIGVLRAKVVQCTTISFVSSHQAVDVVFCTTIL
ncbi:hypothetical protein QFZ80_007711 [Paenibacillus sp. V4I7]|nr:hypothetical protein [Paenibacillus sp. V4I7]MDQ0917643.1 hypothetical protein [Paenibacillus sp. V4I5]